MVCGGVPADWRARRVKATLQVVDPLPFVDVEHAETHEYLSTEMADELNALGAPILDVGAVRGKDRRITRAIANWAYTALDDDGSPQYSGIRYMSRLSDWECWAIFDGSDVKSEKIDLIQTSDPDLQRVTNLFGLRIF
jgi:hypothetical protein